MARAQGVVFFQTVVMVLALFPRDALAKDANMSDDGIGFSGMSLAYNARTREEEVDAVLAEAESAAAKVLKPAQTAFWGEYSG